MKRDRRALVARTIVEIVEAQDSGIRRLDLIKALEERIPPEGEERGSYDAHPQLSKFAVQALFVSAGAVKAGWIRKVKGLWSITPEGSAALKRYTNVTDFHNELVRLYRAWRKDSQQLDVDDTPAPDDSTGLIALQEAEERAGVDIQTYLGNLPPQQFQEVIGFLLEAMGYHVSYLADPGPDGGIDLIAYEDPLGAKGARIKVQAKRHQGTVGRPTVQALIGSLSDGETGLVVALSGFTKDAEQFARTHQTKRLTLMDGFDLVALWVKHYDRISEEGRSLLRLKPVYFLDAED